MLLTLLVNGDLTLSVASLSGSNDEAIPLARGNAAFVRYPYHHKLLLQQSQQQQ
jgi:hypothetical protein